MRRGRPAARLSTRIAAATGIALLAVSLGGCGVVAKEFSDGDFAETIPAELAASGRGVTDSFASKGLDGFTFYLSVGIDVDRAAIDEDDLAAFLRIILVGNDLPTDKIRMSVQNADGDFLDLEQLALQASPGIELFGSSETTLVLDSDDARTIVEAVWGE
ncbi:hypothetical protein [Microbacterium sp. H83]|uniref:hypothetical protein n=1 Tax=Microbacterium sp. H83 TaxID=1827324 RepID=UPI0007F4A052|nr:hypothetical protein [Microbacterium sp. H83]OAN38392.1 hypothetical protein A4X16_03120 [Microbacterium sp. H83]